MNQGPQLTSFAPVPLAENTGRQLLPMCVFGEDFFFSFCFFCLGHSPWASWHLGASMHAWAEVTQRVLPSTVCAVPKFQSRLHFSKSTAQGNWGNCFPGASPILFVRVSFMQIGNIPTTKLSADHLPRKWSCGCLMAVLSAFLISPLRAV